MEKKFTQLCNITQVKSTLMGYSFDNPKASKPKKKSENNINKIA